MPSSLRIVPRPHRRRAPLRAIEMKESRAIDREDVAGRGSPDAREARHRCQRAVQGGVNLFQGPAISIVVEDPGVSGDIDVRRAGAPDVPETGGGAARLLDPLAAVVVQDSPRFAHGEHITGRTAPNT